MEGTLRWKTPYEREQAANADSLMVAAVACGSEVYSVMSCEVRLDRPPVRRYDAGEACDSPRSSRPYASANPSTRARMSSMDGLDARNAS